MSNTLIDSVTSGARGRSLARALPWLVGGVSAASFPFYLWAEGVVVQAVHYMTASVLAAIAVSVGAFLNKASDRRPWHLLAAGVWLWAVGDGLWYVYSLVLETEAPYPSIADVAYLGAYLPMAWALYILARRRSPGRDREGMIDAAIITIALGVVAWVTLMEPYAGDHSLTIMERVITIAYPVMDVLLLAATVRMLVTPSTQTAASRLLAGGLLITLVGDTVYSVQALAGTYVDGSWPDVLWMAGTTLFAMSALHCSMNSLTEASEGRRSSNGRARFAALAGANLLIPATLVLEDWVVGADASALVMGGGAVALTGLLVARVSGLVAQVESKVTELETQGATLRSSLEERADLTNQLEQLAYSDPLTGLGNRTRFLDHVHRALNASSPLTVLFLDLDDFKTINDTFGHSAGDELLAQVARRISSVVRPTDTVARLGGDEFAILVEGTESIDPGVLALRIATGLEEPFKIGGRRTVISASVGIAAGEGAETEVEELLRNADLAMYEAKEAGKNQHRFYEEGMHERIVEREGIRWELRRALEEGHLSVVFQPIVELDAGRPVGAEALVRWVHPEKGHISPAWFVPVAEEAGLVHEIDRFVLNAAVSRLAEWRSTWGIDAPYLSVNLSARHFQSADLLPYVKEVLERYNVPGESLVLEITESAIATEPETAVMRMNALKNLGIRLALDDFGTGYSSLARFSTFPIDIIKIDRSFVNDIEAEGRRGALARVVNTLGATLDLQTVAEGIETSGQADILRSLGCRFGQGFYFARPVLAGEFVRLFEEHQPAPSRV